jgi:NADH-quinone oxidoreductase subunit G
VTAKTGLNASQMLSSPLQAYVLFNTDIESDSANGAQAIAAMKAAKMVVHCSPFQNELANDYADVMLPIAPFTETAGTFVNTEGLVQSFNGVVKPLAETRPGWKVLRVLGNLLQLPGFEYTSAEQVREDVLGGNKADVKKLLNNAVAAQSVANSSAAGLQRIGDVPLYQADNLVRRAESLQQTKDAGVVGASLNPATALELGLSAGDKVKVTQTGSLQLPLVLDERVPLNCVRVVAAHPATVALGASFGPISVERA